MGPGFSVANPNVSPAFFLFSVEGIPRSPWHALLASSRRSGAWAVFVSC